MDTEIKDALRELKDNLEAKSKEMIKADLDKMEAKFDGLVTSEELKTLNTTVEEMKSANEELQQHLDQLSIKSKTEKENLERQLTPFGHYRKALGEALEAKFDEIKAVGGGSKVQMEVKATMTLGNNLTGDAVNTYKPEAVDLPSQKVNVADLIPSISSQTGLYVYYRETAPTGAFASVAEGAAKPEVEFNLTEVTATATYIGGYIRISKVMMQDLPFLTSFLPRALRREYWKAENSIFEGVISTAASGVSTGTGGVAGIIEDIGVLESDDYDVTGIVLNPADWAELAATQVPGSNQSAVVSYVNNQMIIAGVPVFKASWVTAGEYILGDWFWAKKIEVDGLKVEFFEQDANNVTTNLITVRCEARTVCAVEKPAAFLLGNIAPAT